MMDGGGSTSYGGGSTSYGSTDDGMGLILCMMDCPWFMGMTQDTNICDVIDWGLDCMSDCTTETQTTMTQGRAPCGHVSCLGYLAATPFW